MKPTVHVDTEPTKAQIAYVQAKLAALEPTTPTRMNPWRSVGIWLADLTDRDLTWRQRLDPQHAAHRLVHNGPLWWTCRGCRELARAERTHP